MTNYFLWLLEYSVWNHYENDCASSRSVDLPSACWLDLMPSIRLLRPLEWFCFQESILLTITLRWLLKRIEESLFCFCLTLNLNSWNYVSLKWVLVVQEVSVKQQLVSLVLVFKCTVLLHLPFFYSHFSFAALLVGYMRSFYASFLDFHIQTRPKPCFCITARTNLWAC